MTKEQQIIQKQDELIKLYRGYRLDPQRFLYTEWATKCSKLESELADLKAQEQEFKWRNDHILSEFENEFGHHPTSTNKYRWQGVNWLLEKLNSK